MVFSVRGGRPFAFWISWPIGTEEPAELPLPPLPAPPPGVTNLDSLGRLLPVLWEASPPAVVGPCGSEPAAANASNPSPKLPAVVGFPVLPPSGRPRIGGPRGVLCSSPGVAFALAAALRADRWLARPDVAPGPRSASACPDGDCFFSSSRSSYVAGSLPNFREARRLRSASASTSGSLARSAVGGRIRSRVAGLPASGLSAGRTILLRPPESSPRPGPGLLPGEELT